MESADFSTFRMYVCAIHFMNFFIQRDCLSSSLSVLYGLTNILCEIRRSTFVIKLILLLLEQPLLHDGCMRGCCRLKDALSLNCTVHHQHVAVHLVRWVVVEVDARGRQLGANLGLIDEA